MANELNEFLIKHPIQLVRQVEEFSNANRKFEDEKTGDGDFCVRLQFTCNGQREMVHGFGANKENAKRAASKVAMMKLSPS